LRSFINGLEIININHSNAETLMKSYSFIYFIFCKLHKVLTVVDSGQTVYLSHGPELAPDNLFCNIHTTADISLKHMIFIKKRDAAVVDPTPLHIFTL